MQEKLQPGLNTIYARLEQMLNTRPVKSMRVAGGYSSAHRLLVEFSSGLRVFVKSSTDALTAEWLRNEYRIYQSVFGTFMPDFIGWDDDGIMPILVLEDLSSGSWPKSWSGEMIAAVLKMLATIKQATPPSGLPTLESMRSELASWHLVAERPDNFLSLNLCSAFWLENALPILIEAENNAVLVGEELIHLDVRSDNLCFLGDRVILVDWNWACVGNSIIDVLFWLPSVALEGGPAPEQIIDGDPNMVALIAGFWAHRAGMPPPGSASTVRQLQQRQLEIALPWSAKLLGLPEVDR